MMVLLLYVNAKVVPKQSLNLSYIYPESGSEIVVSNEVDICLCCRIGFEDCAVEDRSFI